MSNPMSFDEAVYKDLKRAMASLMVAFRWMDSPQGHKYWAEVHNNLRLIDEEFAKYMVEKGDE